VAFRDRLSAAFELGDDRCGDRAAPAGGCVLDVPRDPRVQRGPLPEHVLVVPALVHRTRRARSESIVDPDGSDLRRRA
jgi:hypothetical protein